MGVLMRPKAFALFLVAGFFAPSMWAQQSKPDPPGGQPAPSAPPSRGMPMPGDPGERRMNTPRILYVSGKVMMEDGTPPPEPMSVEMICSGQIVQQVLTRAKGQFDFELGNRNTFAAIGADVHGPNSVSLGQDGDQDPFGTGSGIRSSGLGRYDLNGCTVRLSPLPGYSSNSIGLGFRSVFDKPDVGAIILKRRNDVQGTTVSLNALKAPKKAKKSYQKARKELEKKEPNLEKAARELDKAVAEFPEYASAWQLIGEVRQRRQDNAGAHEAFSKAIQADPNYLTPYLSLTRLEVESSNWEGALNLTTKLVSLDPYLPISQYYHGLTNFYSGHMDEAAEVLGRLKESGQDKNFPASHYLMGSILSARGEIPAAAQEYQLFLERSQIAGEIRSQIQAQLDQWVQQGLIQPASGSGK